MLILFETPAGYAIFKLLNENKLAESENLYKDFTTAESASKIVKLIHFHKFEDTTEALAASTALVDSKLSKSLKKTLRSACSEIHEQLAVADAKLGNAIKDKLQLSCVSNTSIQELMRCIRSQVDSLITDVSKKEMTAMALGLAHSLSRYKLKFSPDKIDTMVIQGICLLDELDKQLNNYIMRAREWYGWHFPELGKIVPDNFQYIETMKLIGQRENAVNADMSDILPEDIEQKVKEAAETSMGSEITPFDAEHMQGLCLQIKELQEYRSYLCGYLKSRMMALAPNLSVLVGDLIGARLISRAGSLTNLAKHPASTLQILGAEKALFRALKSKKNTPKYGLIYHSQLVGQSSNKNKGKISRMLAAKASLATRVDALGDNTSNCQLGEDHRATLELRLKQLEEGNIRRISGTAKAKAKFEKYHSKNDYMQYSTAVDSTLSSKKPLIEEIDTKQNEEMSKKKKKKKHTINDEQENDKEEGIKSEPDISPKKKKKHSAEFKTEDTAESSTAQEIVQAEPDIVSKKKKKYSVEPKIEGATAEISIKQEDVQVNMEMDTPTKKKKQNVESEDTEKLDTSSKKRKRHREPEEKSSSVSEAQVDSDPVPKKKKKKKKHESIETEEATCAKTDTTLELDASVEIIPETSDGQKKKKKKKREKESEETQEMSVSVAEVEEPILSEKKKKKKKLKHD